MKYLCTISYRDAPTEYTMQNEIVEDTGRPGDIDETWVRRVGRDEEFRAYRDELWPITDGMAQMIMAWRQGHGIISGEGE